MHKIPKFADGMREIFHMHTRAYTHTYNLHNAVKVDTIPEFADKMREMLPGRAQSVSTSVKLTETKNMTTEWCVCMHVCMHVRIYVCVCVYIYVYACK